MSKKTIKAYPLDLLKIADSSRQNNSAQDWTVIWFGVSPLGSQIACDDQINTWVWRGREMDYWFVDGVLYPADPWERPSGQRGPHKMQCLLSTTVCLCCVHEATKTFIMAEKSPSDNRQPSGPLDKRQGGVGRESEGS